MEKRKTYPTTDFYTAAVLISEGFQIIKVIDTEKKNRIKEFHFEDSDALRDTILAYANNTLTGKYKDFRNAIDTVKELIYNS